MTSSNPASPTIDIDRIAATYEELKGMEVELDANPIEFGPKRFNNRIAKVRSLLSRIEQIFLQTSEDWHYFKRIVNAKKSIYELEKRELMVNDPRCRMGRHQGERGDLADVQLRPQIEAIRVLEQAVYDLEILMVAIKSRRTDLKDAQGRMKDQMKMIEHDLGMGARWGDTAPSNPTSREADELDTMLSNVDKKLGWKSDDEQVSLEAEEEESDEDEVEETLTEAVTVEEEVGALIDEIVSVTEEPASPAAPFQEETAPVLEFAGGSESETALPILEEGGVSESPSNPEASATESEIDEFFANFDFEQSQSKSAPKSHLVVEGIDDLIATLANE